ncbi:unnamed protein product [Penicillium nalgiovense]|nr:unnamed protein product [Penicillium nalgiovense]
MKCQICAIIRDHCGIRLYVPPIAWTSDQLRLLICQFRLQNRRRRGKQQTQSATQDIGFQDDGSRAADSAAQTKPGGGRYSDAMRTTTKLAQISTLVAKKSAIQDILGAYNVYVLDSECLPFYFNRRAAVKLLTDGVFSNNSVAPSLAYITFDKI